MVIPNMAAICVLLITIGSLGIRFGVLQPYKVETCDRQPCLKSWESSVGELVTLSERSISSWSHSAPVRVHL